MKVHILVGDLVDPGKFGEDVERPGIDTVDRRPRTPLRVEREAFKERDEECRQHLAGHNRHSEFIGVSALESLARLESKGCVRRIAIGAEGAGC